MSEYDALTCTVLSTTRKCTTFENKAKFALFTLVDDTAHLCKEVNVTVPTNFNCTEMSPLPLIQIGLLAGFYW
jgi:hypothetical protein